MVEHADIGLARDVVVGEPLIFLRRPLLPERLIRAAIAVQRPRPADVVRRVGPDDGAEQRPGLRGRRTHSLDDHDLRGQGDADVAVVMVGPVPAGPGGRLAAAQRGEDGGNVALDARGEAVPARVNVLKVEQGDLVVVPQPRSEFDGQSGFACAGSPVNGDDHRCGGHEIERTCCCICSRCGAARRSAAPDVLDDARHRTVDLVPDGVEVRVAAVPGILDALVQQVTAGDQGVEASEHADLVHGFLVRGSVAQPGIVVNVQGQNQIALAEPGRLPFAGNVVLRAQFGDGQPAGRPRIDGPPRLVAGGSRRVHAHLIAQPFGPERCSQHHLGHR